MAQEVLLVLHEKYPQVESMEELVPLASADRAFQDSWAPADHGAAGRVLRGRRWRNCRCPIRIPARWKRRSAARCAGRLIEALGRLGERCRDIFRMKLDGTELRRDPAALRRGFVEHRLHVGFPLPQATHGADGWPLGEEAMSKEEIRKLLGGYATGTLTPEERRLLFEARWKTRNCSTRCRKRTRCASCWTIPQAGGEVRAALEPAPGCGFRVLGVAAAPGGDGDGGQPGRRAAGGRGAVALRRFPAIRRDG